MGPSSGDCNPTLNEIQLLRWVLLVELWPKLRCKSSYKWALVASPPKLQSTSSHKLNLEGSLQLASTGAHSFITLHASSPLASTFDLINVSISIRSSCILKIVFKEKCKNKRENWFSNFWNIYTITRYWSECNQGFISIFWYQNLGKCFQKIGKILQSLTFKSKISSNFPICFVREKPLIVTCGGAY